ncbi:hypothetical protein [Sphingomonas sp.]|uniref:hypothetical protein n=1 Tax=Sphingomonas sp. TaxID=28214 RepID=UPI001DC43FFE|nr:hypothetical protein [Sphingomonas sp.]MBX9796364.1 DUF1636 domain-containing protein [Sphingomonas sp.]
METGLSRGRGARQKILVCATCQQRLGTGFGRNGRQTLARALRAHLGISRWWRRRATAKVEVVEVKCLAACPRGAVTVANAARLDRWRMVPRGADLAALLDQLDITA